MPKFLQAKQQRRRPTNPASLAVTQPTRRKVSEEDMQQQQQKQSNSESASLAARFNEDGTYADSALARTNSLWRRVSSSSLDNKGSSANEHNSLRLKRPSPSMCLVGLSGTVEACKQSPVPESPVTCATTFPQDPTAAPWGHFIDHEEECTSAGGHSSPRSPLLPTSTSSPTFMPYLKTPRRRPIRTRRRNGGALKGFVLTLPEVEETADQLGSLSF